MLTWALVESPHQRSLGRKHAADGRCQPYVPACPRVSLRTPGIAHHTDQQHRHCHCGPPCLSGEFNGCSPRPKSMLTMIDRFKVCPW
jgi:hypothetical protein